MTPKVDAPPRRPRTPAFMRVHLQGFLAECAAARTASTYSTILSGFFSFLEQRGTIEATSNDVRSFVARLARSGERRAAATRNLDRAALRRFAEYAARLGVQLELGELEFEREPAHDPCVMTAGEVRRLFEVVASDGRAVLRARNLALVAILTQIGLRVHELVALNADQIDAATETLLAVKGKGDSSHDLPLNVETMELLRAWLRARPALAKLNETALFVSRRGRRLSIRSVERLFVRLRAAIGTSKKITPHTARHSVATIALDQGTDVVVVSQLLRHSSIRTTQKYIHLVDRQRREAVRRLGALVPRAVLGETAGAVDGLTDNVPANDTKPVDHERPFDDIRDSRRAA